MAWQINRKIWILAVLLPLFSICPSLRAVEIAKAARGSFTFDTPNSRAVLFHFKKN